MVFVGLVMRKSDNFPGYRSLSNDQFSIWARNVKTGKTPLDHCSYLIRSSSSWDHVSNFCKFLNAVKDFPIPISRGQNFLLLLLIQSLNIFNDKRFDVLFY